YANDGWVGWGDWLGTNYVAPYLRVHRPFKEARTFVQQLGLRSLAEWDKYCRSGKKPADIPASPAGVYRNDGSAGAGDWLGTGNIANQSRRYRSFKKARAFVRSLGLKLGKEWDEYCKSGKKPADIPAQPSNGYANSGWAGMSDWLGAGKAAPGQYRSFKKA